MERPAAEVLFEALRAWTVQNYGPAEELAEVVIRYRSGRRAVLSAPREVPIPAEGPGPRQKKP